MVDLSPRTRSHVAALFRRDDVPEAEVLLATECAEDLPILGAAATHPPVSNACDSRLFD
jgi:hypothetical protein